MQLDAYLQIYASIIKAAEQNQAISDAEEKSIIILRLLYAKTKAIRKLLDGINFNYVSVESEETIVEPTSLFDLVRNVLELIYVYEYVYIKPDTPEKKEIAYLVYMCAGLKERLSMGLGSPSVDEQIRKTEEKANAAKEQIFNSSYFQGLTERSQNAIRNKLNSKHPNYRFIYEDNDVIEVKQEEACEGIGMTGDFFKKTYAYLSTHTHPTYLSLVQFRDAYIGQEMGPLHEGFAETATLFLLSMLSILIDDARNQVPYIETIYDGLDDDMKNQMNVLVRLTKADIIESN